MHYECNDDDNDEDDETSARHIGVGSLCLELIACVSHEGHVLRLFVRESFSVQGSEETWNLWSVTVYVSV